MSNITAPVSGEWITKKRKVESGTEKQSSCKKRKIILLPSDKILRTNIKMLFSDAETEFPKWILNHFDFFASKFHFDDKQVDLSSFGFDQKSGEILLQLLYINYTYPNSKRGYFYHLKKLEDHFISFVHNIRPLCLETIEEKCRDFMLGTISENNIVEFYQLMKDMEWQKKISKYKIVNDENVQYYFDNHLVAVYIWQRNIKSPEIAVQDISFYHTYIKMLDTNYKLKYQEYERLQKELENGGGEEDESEESDADDEESD